MKRWQNRMNPYQGLERCDLCGRLNVVGQECQCYVETPLDRQRRIEIEKGERKQEIQNDDHAGRGFDPRSESL